MKERYIPIRPGIEEHLIRGRMSFFELGIYILIHLQADYRTGVWHGSAPRLLATCPRGTTLRKVQRAMERMGELGYLKCFRGQGERGNTSYLIDKFTVRLGALTGQRLNADNSSSCKTPSYDLVALDDAPNDAPSDALSRSKKKERKKRKTKPCGKARR
jgi:hypothetical protein